MGPFFASIPFLFIIGVIVFLATRGSKSQNRGRGRTRTRVVHDPADTREPWMIAATGGKTVRITDHRGKRTYSGYDPTDPRPDWEIAATGGRKHRVTVRH
jgi:hypothetical protein